MPLHPERLLPAGFLDTFGGKPVADGRALVFSAEEIATRNSRLRLSRGWFDENQLFIAEGSLDREDVPDYYYLDVRDPVPRPVRYFHLSPTGLGVCAASVEAFTEGTWTLESAHGPTGF